MQKLMHCLISPHKQDANQDYSHLALPETEAMHREVFSLPMSPVMEQREVNAFIGAGRAFKCADFC